MQAGQWFDWDTLMRGDEVKHRKKMIGVQKRRRIVDLDAPPGIGPREDVLDLFRGEGRCEFCGRWASVRDPHHYYYTRGFGGGTRIDHPWNLVSLCRGWHLGQWVSCHDLAERGEITRDTLLAIVAAREGRQQAEIVDALTIAKWGRPT